MGIASSKPVSVENNQAQPIAELPFIPEQVPLPQLPIPSAVAAPAEALMKYYQSTPNARIPTTLPLNPEIFFLLTPQEEATTPANELTLEGASCKTRFKTSF